MDQNDWDWHSRNIKKKWRTLEMKKLMMMVCVSMMLMTGCSNKNEETKKIGVAQIVEHTSLNTIRDSFLSEMKELGYGEDSFDIKNAGNDENTLNSIMQKFASDNVDCIVAIATPTAQVASKYSTDIPVVFSAVSDPIAAGLLDSLDTPNKNMTGTSDEIQVDQILQLALDIQPDLKEIGVLYSAGEANSASYVEKLQQLCDEKGLTLTKTSIATIADLQSAAVSLASKVDAIFTPNDNTIASSIPIVVEAVKEAKIPFYSGADSMVQDGAFATVGINYEELGKETAHMVDQIVQGTTLKDIPVKIFKNNLNIYINEKVLNELGITLPQKIKDNTNLKMIGDAS